VDAAQAVVIAVIPRRVGVKQLAERGKIRVRERFEDGAGNVYF